MKTSLKWQEFGGRLRREITHVVICILLMTLIWGTFYVVNEGIADNKEREISERVYYSGNEFVRTIDCATIIDENGLDKAYEVSFEIMTDLTGNVQVLFQNGTGAKYAFLECVRSTTEYKKYTLIIYPTLSDENVDEAFLAFYGEYGTGVIPSIRNVKFDVCNSDKK